MNAVCFTDALKVLKLLSDPVQVNVVLIQYQDKMIPCISQCQSTNAIFIYF